MSASATELGVWIPFTGDKRPAMAAAASSQITLATAGSRLADHTKAQDVALFWQTGADLSEAYLKTAYWLAVASRVTGKRALAGLALGNLQAGYARMATYASSDAASIAEVYRQAGVAALAAGAKGVAAVLGQHGTAGMIATRQQAADEQKLSTQLVAAAKKTADDTLRPWPFGPGKPPGWLYGLYAGGAIAGGLILWHTVKPYVAGARALVARKNRRRR